MRDRFSVARVSGAGSRRQKLLVVGDQLFVNAAPQTPGSIGDLSAALTASPLRDGVGVDLDVLWDLAPAMRAIGDGTSSRQLWRYDGVVVVVGKPAARAPVLRLQSLLLQVIAELAAASSLVIVFAASATRQPDGRRSRHRAMQLMQQLETAGHHIPALQAEIDPGGRLLDPTALAAGVLGLLTAGLDSSASPGSQQGAEAPAEDRQAAVDRSMAVVSGPSAGLQRLVRLARDSFEVPYAQVNLLDQGRLHTIAFAGRTSHGLQRTLSGIVAERGQPLLIEDTRMHPQLSGIDETQGAEGIRFFVGWPIRSWDGYCIGAICVFDTEPHEVEATDDALAHDIALLAEAEILTLIQDDGDPPPVDRDPG